jgi:hypothetical protein
MIGESLPADIEDLRQHLERVRGVPGKTWGIDRPSGALAKRRA